MRERSLTETFAFALPLLLAVENFEKLRVVVYFFALLDMILFSRIHQILSFFLQKKPIFTFFLLIFLFFFIFFFFLHFFSA